MKFAWLIQPVRPSVLAGLFVLTQIFYGLMLWVTIPGVMAYSDGLKIFDLQPAGYSVEDARHLLDALGSEGRQYYLSKQIPLDLVYPGLFGATYALLLVWLFRERVSDERAWRYGLIGVPLLAGAFDYLENLGIAAMLIAHPGMPDSLIQAANSFTLLKSFFTTGTFLMLAAGIVLWVAKKWRR